MYCGFALQIIDERSISCPRDVAAVGEFIIYLERKQVIFGLESTFLKRG